MYFEDMSNYSCYLSAELPGVKNVGWIEAGVSYEKGDVPIAVFEKLRRLLVGSAVFDAHVNRIRGFHPCNLCGERNLEEPFDGECTFIGNSEVWVPGACGEGYFAAPSMIIHYMKVHGYKPPAEFVEALMAVDLEKEYSAQDAYILSVSRLSARCDSCAGTLVDFSEGSCTGQRCPGCGWSVVTTCISGISVDDKEYKVSCSGDYRNKAHIRAVSEMAGCNFIVARNALRNVNFIVFSGQAVDVARIMGVLESAGLEYVIEPEFKWST